MPLLAQEPDLFPDDLLDRDRLGIDTQASWWAMYTMSRREKELMRQLRRLSIPHYGPTILKRVPSPSGRIRNSWLPLFANYVFLYGDEDDRYRALTTNCISRTVKVSDGLALTHDLRQVRRLISTGAAITPEARLEVGDPVRVRSGPFTGYEGVVIKRHGTARLLISVGFLQQGASVLLEDCHVEPLL